MKGGIGGLEWVAFILFISQADRSFGNEVLFLGASSCECFFPGPQLRCRGVSLSTEDSVASPSPC